MEWSKPDETPYAIKGMYSVRNEREADVPRLPDYGIIKNGGVAFCNTPN